jgi:hypothetical protein
MPVAMPATGKALQVGDITLTEKIGLETTT